MTVFKNQKILKMNQEKGSALYYAVVVLSILLAMVLGLSSIITPQIKTARTIGDSLQAFYAADTGIEEAFYQNSNGTPFEIIDITSHLDFNGNNVPDPNEPIYKVEGGLSPSSVPFVKSTGTYFSTKRAIRISF